MLGSEILDVAIGLIMMFLLVSLIASSIKEAFETVLNHRAKDLEAGLREMLGDVRREGIVPALYRHPLIDGLFRGRYQPGRTRNLPSYIPSRAFALALVDVIVRGNANPLQNGESLAPADAIEPTLEGFKHAVAALPLGSNLRGALVPLLTVAGNDGAKLLYEIERWYDGVMDRVSGWYKKRTQIMLAGIGLSLAVAMNIDAVAIVRYLNTSQTARQVLITQVEHYQAGHTGTTISNNDPSELIDPMGWLERQGGVPLGWIFHPLPNQTGFDFEHDWRHAPTNLSAWLFKIAGLLLTGFAVTLGAPFWFDVLNRFMVVRSTVKPDEKSPIEKSKA